MDKEVVRKEYALNWEQSLKTLVGMVSAAA